MKPRELVATATAPGGVQLRLIRHDGDHIIMLDANELMNSRLGGSEEALALGACERLRETAEPHFLIGGYGMGFTLRAALAALGPHARVSVVELVPEIIEWAKTPMAALTGDCLEDPRVRLLLADVAEEIASSQERYDAILLDVDNGPSALTCAKNDRLYAMPGLAAARTALRPGGVLAVWSATADDAFLRRLRDVGFKVEQVTVRARRNGKGPRHVIWFARRHG